MYKSMFALLNSIGTDKQKSKRKGTKNSFQPLGGNDLQVGELLRTHCIVQHSKAAFRFCNVKSFKTTITTYVKEEKYFGVLQ